MTQPWETIPEMVLSAADRFGDAEAVVDGPLRLTFTQVVDRIRCAAGAFAGLGIKKGERVAVWAPNSAEWMIAAFGLLTAGGVLVPVNTRFKTEEAADIIGRSGAKAVLVEKGFLGLDYTAPAGVPVIDLKSDFLSSGSPFAREVSGDRHLRHHLHVGHHRQAQGRDDESRCRICGCTPNGVSWPTCARATAT